MPLCKNLIQATCTYAIVWHKSICRTELNLLVLLLLQVSYVKAVDIYFIVSFAFIFAATIEYVLVLLNTGLKRHLSSSNEHTEHSETVNISTLHFD